MQSLLTKKTSFHPCHNLTFLAILKDLYSGIVYQKGKGFDEVTMMKLWLFLMSKACFLNFRLTHLLSLGKSREQEGIPQHVPAEIEEGWVHQRLRGKCLKISFYSKWEITLLGKEYRGKINLLMACSRERFKCQSNRKFRKTKSSMLFSCSTHCLG